MGLNTRVLAERSKPCVDCGAQLPAPCMDMDHVRGGKADTVSVYSGAALEEEIAKCDVRCPTCHRLRHFWDSHRDHPFFLTYKVPASWYEVKTWRKRK